MLRLILGGARSGKSRLAERLVEELAKTERKEKVYIATAQAADEEMRQRINIHRQQRGEDWLLREEPLRLAASLRELVRPNRVVLIDCLTLWLSNCLQQENRNFWGLQSQALLDVLEQLSGDVIAVSNETGLGVVPMGELSRRFVDESGRLHQALAQQADCVVFTVAGLAHVLKGELPASLQ